MLRIITLFTLLHFLFIPVVAQDTNLPEKLSFKADKMPLQEVLKQLTNLYSLQFYYSPNKIPLQKLVTVDISSVSLADFLNVLCHQLEIGYVIENSKIMFVPNEEEKQKDSKTVCGFVTDSVTGERLIGATIMFPELNKGTSTNVYGYYSYNIPKTVSKLRCSYMGYVASEENISAIENRQINIFLRTSAIPIREVKLTSKINDKISSIRLGQDQVPLAFIRKTPSLLGENDVMQFLKMMPGILSANEASSGLFIRGCTPQQSAFLLDDAPLFNLYHISGWFSTVNPDALKDVNIYRGQLPGKAGGALSSIVDLRLRDGNNQHFVVTGGLGTILSRLTIEGPLIRNKASFIISGRRSYLDQVIRLFDTKNNTGMLNIYFYDLNAKLNYTINQKNTVYLSLYSTKDNLNETNGTSWGNNLLSFRWNHVFSAKLFANLTATGSNYKHQFQGMDDNNFNYELTTRIRDYNCKLDFTYYLPSNHKLLFGIHTNYQDLLPILYQSGNPEVAYTLTSSYLKKRMLFTAYSTYELELNENLGIEGGIRLSLLQNLWEGQYKPLLRPQPLLTLRYKLTESSSLKAGYSRNYQFNHGASVFDMLIPFERYLFTDAMLKPQYADHFSAGYYKRFGNSDVELSVEPYFSEMYHQYRFVYGQELFIGKDYQSLAIEGIARSYGVECSLRKLTGRFTGILNYTLAKVVRKEEGVNQNKYFSPYYDRRHNLSLCLMFDASQKISFSASWFYMSGNPYNLPIAKYEISGVTVPLFDPSEMYTHRMPAYHRLDAGILFKFSKRKHYQHSLSLSVYNVYAHQNPVFYYYRDVLDGDLNKGLNSAVYSQKNFNMVSYYMFQFVPAFSYEFKFF